MSIITLTTDFGLKDGYVGVVKGVILGICPPVRIIDLSHFIAPQNVLEAALTLGRTARFFPAGTVHVAVVDPGVGTIRRPIAARIGEQYFIGPDNGIFSVVLKQADDEGWKYAFRHLDDPAFWLKEVSNVFHGRDIFAPCAAHLASGVPFEQLGSPMEDPIRLRIPEPRKTAQGWQGEVLHVDSFGNLATNITAEMVGMSTNMKVRCGGAVISGIVRAYGERQTGELVALEDSAGLLSIAVVNGSAAQRLKANLGTLVEITYS